MRWWCMVVLSPLVDLSRLILRNLSNFKFNAPLLAHTHTPQEGD
jgi:hypothetical protein